jgi:hypothetical protein
MPKYNRNSGKPWTPAEISKLEELAGQNTPTRVIGLKLGRTPAAVISEASKENISLKPTNQSPYNRKNKVLLGTH